MKHGITHARNIMYLGKRFALILFTLAFFSTPSFALEVAGVKLDDTTNVGNTTLKLNGAGIRYRAVAKVYVTGLYLAEKKATAADAIALGGPKRIQIVMLRDVSAERFGQSFMDGLNNNSTKPEKTQIVDQMLKFGEMFANTPELKKGDVITADWIPGVGTLNSLNGQAMAKPFPDIAFFNALLKIWLGEKPASEPLKQQLLGAAPAQASKEL
jgi:Chalcone isomerase-like